MSSGSGDNLRLSNAGHHRLLRSLMIYLDRKMQKANEEQAHALFEKHRGNMRDALRELYDLQSKT